MTGPSPAELVASLAEAVGWVLPAQVAVVVLGERRQDAFPLPPGVLADWTGPEPCLLVPDPDGPGLAWLQLGENAAEVAQRIHVHPQTVRYRMRQIHELFGDQLRDPDRRFELQLALRIRTLTGRREPG